MNYLAEFQKSNGLTPDGVLGKHTAEVMMKVLEISSPIAFSHFIAQTQHESGNFSAGRENLNYSKEVLQNLFGKYFRDLNISTYIRNPELIANRIYCNRMGNGDEASGDGWKYRGCGSLQLTGKTNIQLYLKHAGLPIDNDPNVLLTGIHYFNTAKYFFDINNVWKFCQSKKASDILAVSKIINLGSATATATPIGLAERSALTKTYFKLLC